MTLVQDHDISFFGNHGRQLKRKFHPFTTYSVYIL